MKLTLALAILASMLAACGDGAPSPPKSAADGTAAAQGTEGFREPREIVLTADHIRRHIARTTEARLLQQKMTTDGKGQDMATVQRFGAELRELNKKHGFDNEDGYDAQWSIGIVLSGFDHGSRSWVDPGVRFKKQIEALRKQAGLSDEDRNIAIKAVEEMMAKAPTPNPANVKLITGHYDALRKAVTGN